MLGNALRLLRVFHDMRQNELADKLGLSKSHISEIENGNRTPSLDVLERYSEFFKIPASSILFFSEQIPSAANNYSHTTRMKSTISAKIIQFLKLIEEKTELNGL